MNLVRCDVDFFAFACRAVLGVGRDGIRKLSEALHAPMEVIIVIIISS